MLAVENTNSVAAAYDDWLGFLVSSRAVSTLRARVNRSLAIEVRPKKRRQLFIGFSEAEPKAGKATIRFEPTGAKRQILGAAL